MADDGSPQSRNPWTRPRFPCRVQWDAEEMRFQEALGLDAEARSITHRAGGNSEVFSPFTMPGLKKAGNVTLKKGVVKANSTLQRPVGAQASLLRGFISTRSGPSTGRRTRGRSRQGCRAI